MAISEQERRRRAAAAERARQERERLRLEDKRRSDELEAKRLGVQQQEQERLAREQQSREADAQARREREAAESSFAGQTYQAARTVAPPLAGLYAGHKQAVGIERRQAAMAPEAQASMGTGRRFAPYAARSLLFLPEGYYLRNQVAPEIENQYGRDLVRAGGTGMMLAGGALLGEGAVKALTPADRGGPRVPAIAEPPAAPPAAPAAPAPATTAPAPNAPRPHADRLTAAARAAGAKGPLNKATAASYLETNLNAGNRAAVAAELGIKPGRNFASRISTAVRNMANTRGVSSFLLPAAVGAGVYDALANPAEAGNADVAEYASARLSNGDTLAKVEDVYSDYAKFARARGQTPIPERAFMRQLTDQGIGTARIGGANRVTASINPGEYVAKAAEAPSRATAAAAGTAAAGGTYGAGKLAGYALDAVRNTPLGRFAARAVPAAGAALTAYDIGNMAVEENARPDTMLHGPEEGTMPSTPGNPQFMARQQALARQTRGGDDFDAQLAAFIQAVEEHNAGRGEPYGP